ncbi:hypothetical protein HU200_013339 [Digitaria exilis]|uniref:Cytochrome P450 n=1 Tax=Digitaria exilis TaxID=1010633 RepID=A0A835KJQ9_9POAL|nr:hypothetical protein HU200_013339 [Digitaria exilis]
MYILQEIPSPQSRTVDLTVRNNLSISWASDRKYPYSNPGTHPHVGPTSGDHPVSYRLRPRLSPTRQARPELIELLPQLPLHLISSPSLSFFLLTLPWMSPQGSSIERTQELTGASLEHHADDLILVTHPRAMRRLQEEVRTAVITGNTVDEDHITDLPYLKAVVKETLRLHALIPLLVPREPPADTEIMGYHVPARTRRRGWMPSSSHRRGSRAATLTFGAGRRGFVEASVEMALASLVYHFDWEAAGGGGTEMSGLSVHIKAGLPLRLNAGGLPEPQLDRERHIARQDRTGLVTSRL